MTAFVCMNDVVVRVNDAISTLKRCDDIAGIFLSALQMTA